MRVLYVCTVAFVPSVVLQGQCGYFRRQGFEVFVATSPGADLQRLADAENVTTIPISMRREISPLHDLKSLWQLVGVMRHVRPDVVNASTPKAGLLAGLAAWLTRVPCRVYSLHGLRFETTRGWKRRILTLAEWLACKTANIVPCDSFSVREAAVAAGLVPESKAIVLGAGSANGVDISRFAPSPDLLARASRLRTELRIPEQAPVIGYVGRLTRDKGISELVKAFLRLRAKFQNCHLLLVGGFEEDDAVPDYICRLIATHPRISVTGFVPDAAPYYHIMDVLALPSYREGFGTVVLEAHCAKRPVVGTRVTGLVDSIVDGVTGLLVSPGDADDLSRALARLLSHPDLRLQIGEAGLRRVNELFRCEAVWKRIETLYLDLLQAAGCKVPMRGSPACQL